MNILISGIGGHMGREVLALCQNGVRGAAFSCGVDPMATGDNIYEGFDTVPAGASVDCVIDFSVHAVTPALLRFCTERHLPLVLATTGHTEEELSMIRKAGTKIPLFFSANMSLGVALLVELAKTAARAMPDADIEIVETHHNRKVDAPSGTALMIARALTEVRNEATLHTGRAGMEKRVPGEIGLHAVRYGNIVGIHEVHVGTQSQTITLKHEAHSRALFAEGAIAAAEFLVGKSAGLYTMNDLVKENA